MSNHARARSGRRTRTRSEMGDGPDTRFGLALLLSLALVSCAPGPDGPPETATAPTLPERIMPEDVIPSGDEAEVAADGLVRVPVEGSNAAVFVKSPRPRLQRFDRMVVAPIHIAYKEGRSPLNARDEAALRSRFREKLLGSLRNGPAWQLTDDLGEGVLFVRVAVLDIDIEATDSLTDAAVSMRNPSGGAVLALELYDSEIMEPLFRFAVRRALPGGAFAGRNIDQGRLVSTFDSFADDLAGNLRSQHAIIQEIDRREKAAEAAPSAPAPARN